MPPAPAVTQRVVSQDVFFDGGEAADEGTKPLVKWLMDNNHYGILSSWSICNTIPVQGGIRQTACGCLASSILGMSQRPLGNTR
jgi:hypothetical protein